MKMNATYSLKLPTVIAVLLSVSLSSVRGAPYGWKDAHITYYGSPNGGGTQGGACAYQNTYALGYGSWTAALSSPLFLGGAACGGCYQLKCARVRASRNVRNWCWNYSRTIVVTATNLCPRGSHGGWCDYRPHFDLPMPAFTALARREGGVTPVFYRRVKCVRRGGVRFTIGGNPYFMMILIHNVGGAGDIRSVRIKGQYSGWVNMFRNWGSIWTCRTKVGGALSFLITTTDGRTLVSNRAAGSKWKFGQTWEGSQFR